MKLLTAAAKAAQSCHGKQPWISHGPAAVAVQSQDPILGWYIVQILLSEEGDRV